MWLQHSGGGETAVSPEQPLLEAVVSLLPLLYIEELRAETPSGHLSLQIPSQHLNHL